jgi:hypothetical protein
MGGVGCEEGWPRFFALRISNEKGRPSSALFIRGSKPWFEARAPKS